MPSPERSPADGPAPPPTARLYRQLRHDVDDVYGLLGEVDRKVSAMASTQERHTRRLDEIQQTLDRHEARFDGVDRRFDGVDRRFDGVDRRFDGIDRRLDEQGAQLAEILEILRAGRSG